MNELEIYRKCQDKGRRFVVLYVLWFAREHNRPFAISTTSNVWISGGWRPIWAFQSKQIGGSDAGRQLRFLYDKSKTNGYQIEIEKKNHAWYDINGSKHTTPIYRLKEAFPIEDWRIILSDFPATKVDKNGQIEFLL